MMGRQEKPKDPHVDPDFVGSRKIAKNKKTEEWEKGMKGGNDE